MAAQVDSSTEQLPSLALLRIAGFALRQRRLIGLCAVAVGLVALVFSIVKPRIYAATVAFTPSIINSPRGLGQFTGLASQLGLQLDIGTQDQSDFYVALAQSRAILERVIVDTYRVKLSDSTYRTGDLQDLLRVRSTRPGERMWRTVKKLRKMITARGSRQTNIIEVKVEAKHPDLAEGIAARLFVAINEFDLLRRQLQAGSERRFIETRVAAAEIINNFYKGQHHKNNKVDCNQHGECIASRRALLRHDRRVEDGDRLAVSVVAGDDPSRFGRDVHGRHDPLDERSARDRLLT